MQLIEFSLFCSQQETCQWMQTKHITSCGRWTKNDIFLSNNFLADVKVTHLTCSDGNGLVQTAATTRIQKKHGSKAKCYFGKG